MMALWVGHPGNQIAPAQPSAPVGVTQYDMSISVLPGLEMLLELSFPCLTAQAVLLVFFTMPEPEDRLQIFHYVTSKEGKLALLS